MIAMNVCSGAQQDEFLTADRGCAELSDMDTSKQQTYVSMAAKAIHSNVPDCEFENASLANVSSFPPSTFSSLNHDVLIGIVSYLSTQDALRLCETSSRVYTIAKHQALSSITIRSSSNSRDGKRISALCTYFLDDIPGRLHLLRELDLSRCTFYCGVSWRRDLSSASLLARLLSQAHHLRMLKLNWTEALLEAEPRIGQAIAALRELRVLSLTRVWDRALKMVGAMQSAPREVELMGIAGWIPHTTLFASLARLQAMWRLRLVYAPRVCMCWVSVVEEIDVLQRWPSVRRLLVAECGFPTCLIERVFPNAEIWEGDSPVAP